MNIQCIFIFETARNDCFLEIVAMGPACIEHHHCHGSTLKYS